MDVYLYRAEGVRGTVYDFSFNPRVDYEILKTTRKIEDFEILGLTTLDKAKEAVENAYSYRIINRVFASKGKLMSSPNQKRVQEYWKKRLNESFILPSKRDIEMIEGAIIGKIILFREIADFAKQNGIGYEYLLNIIQTLYCERRIQISPAFLKQGAKNYCYFCKRRPCEKCLFGFKDEDILLYAADNYNYILRSDYTYKRPDLNTMEEEVSSEILKFIRSKKSSGIIFSAPYSFSAKMLFQTFAEVLKKGGRILYVTSYNEINEIFNLLATTFNKKRIGIAYKNYEDYRKLDIVIAYKTNYTRFYKAFDLVVYNDLNYAFEEYSDLSYVTKKAAKDKAKFILITANKDRYKESFDEVIPIPFAYGNHLISEPRVEVTRFSRDFEVLIPQMAIDVLKWSIKEGIKNIIFYPHTQKHDKIADFLIFNGINEKLIEFNVKQEDYLSILKSKKNIFISSDIKLSRQPIEDFNIIVLDCNTDFYNAEKLIYISAMASVGKNKRIGEVLFVAEGETEEISLARKCIRNLNKVSWEKGYVKL